MNGTSGLMKRAAVLVLSAAMALTITALPPGGPAKAEAASDRTTGLNVNLPSQEQVSSYINNSGAEIYKKDTFAKEPTKMDTVPVTKDSPSVGLSDIGQLSDETQQNALTVLNNIRYIAGLDKVALSTDASLNQDVQAGMYINYLNAEIEHRPAQPANASDDLYKAGYRGTSSSNIAWGQYSTSYAALDWTDDSDSYNINRVGHRRWELNPTMGKTIFGAVGSHYAIYAFDRSHSSSASGVAWPAHNMPLEYNASGSSLVWSYSYGKSLSRADVAVELTKLDKAGKVEKTWNFDSSTTTDTTSDKYFNVNSEGYGQTGCVIFRPDDISGYHDGDTFHVNIKNSGTVIADYDVNFFSLKPVTGIKLNDSYKIPEGHEKSIKPTFEPSDATDKGYTVKVADESIATYDEKTGKFKGLKQGTTKAVITSSNGKVSAETTIYVIDPKIDDPAVRTFVYNGKEQSAYDSNDLYKKSNWYPGWDTDNFLITATEPGSYFCYVEPAEGFEWKNPNDDEYPFKVLYWTIEKAPNELTKPLTCKNVVYPDQPAPTAEAKAGTIEYKYSGTKNGTYTADKPSKPGTYYVKAFVTGDSHYEDLESDPVAFTIEKSENAWVDELTIPETKEGEALRPQAKAKYGQVRFVYADSADGEYGDAEPVKAGQYFAKAIVDETESYTGLESEPVSFTIAPKPVEKPITTIGKGATEHQVDKFITGQKSDSDVKGSKFGLLRAKVSKVTKSSIKVTWKKVPGAKKYVVYANKCGKKYHYKKYKTVTGTSLTQKKLKKGTYYKYMIVAIDKNGKVITASKTIHASTSGNKKKANFTGLKVNKTKLTLKKGKTYTLKATELKKSGTKVQRHRKPAFESSNTKVVTVSSSGKLKAKKKGSATIYVYTQNGIAKTVKVTVK